MLRLAPSVEGKLDIRGHKFGSVGRKSANISVLRAGGRFCVY